MLELGRSLVEEASSDAIGLYIIVYNIPEENVYSWRRNDSDLNDLMNCSLLLKIPKDY